MDKNKTNQNLLSRTAASLNVAPLICFLLISSPSRAQPNTANMPNMEVARINNQVITLGQVEAHYSELIKQPSTEAVTKKFALDDLIKRITAVQEARRLKLDLDPATQERIDTVLFYALIEKKLNSDLEAIKLNESETKSWYEKNPEIRTSQILVALPRGASPEDEKSASDRLARLKADIKAGKLSFGEAALQNSEDPSGMMGGDMDYRMRDRLDPLYYRAAVRLNKPGEISDPVRTSVGIALIRLTAKHSWMEVDRSHVRRLLAEEKRAAIIDRYLSGLQQKATVSISKSL